MIISAEITTGELLDTLGSKQGKALRFVYDGREVKPGYHVTEIKSGRFEALDCGANPEAWSETFIQLWDIPSEDGRSFMPVGKFLAIMRKVGQHVPFDPAAKLTFEVSDGVEAMQLFKATAIAEEADTVRVTLSRRPSSCKPRDRWLGSEKGYAGTCGSRASPTGRAADELGSDCVAGDACGRSAVTRGPPVSRCRQRRRPPFALLLFMQGRTLAPKLDKLQ